MQVQTLTLSEIFPELRTKDEYVYQKSQADHTAGYLWKPVVESIRETMIENGTKVLDIGCGNGAFTAHLAKLGFVPTGIDPSESGIEQAKFSWPNIDFRVASAYDPIRETLGSFNLVTSLEVVEHLYSPRKYIARICEVLEPGGWAVISTPYHGYWKNLSLTLMGKFDKHFSPLWDHGHIKFWSVSTLSSLLREGGLKEIQFRFAGRFVPFSKSMIAIARKPK